MALLNSTQSSTYTKRLFSAPIYRSHHSPPQSPGSRFRCVSYIIHHYWACFSYRLIIVLVLFIFHACHRNIFCMDVWRLCILCVYATFMECTPCVFFLWIFFHRALFMTEILYHVHACPNNLIPDKSVQ